MTKLLTGLAVLLVGTAILFLFRAHLPPALAFQPEMANVAGRVLAALVVISLFLERALAVINDMLFGAERVEAQHKVMVAGLAPRTDAAAAVSEALRAVEKVDSARERARLLIGFGAALLVSAAGVRTLAGLTVQQGAPTAQPFFTIVDIVLTAGLLAGGSNGLAKLIDLLRERTDQKLAQVRIERALSEGARMRLQLASKEMLGEPR